MNSPQMNPEDTEGQIVGQDISGILEDFNTEYSEDSNSEIENDIEVDRYHNDKVQIKTPMDLFRHFAASMNTELKDPKPGCKKCYGRGYTAIDTKSKYPVPCRCIFKSQDLNRRDAETMTKMLQNVNLNRTQKRAQEKWARKNGISVEASPQATLIQQHKEGVNIDPFILIT